VWDTGTFFAVIKDARLLDALPMVAVETLPTHHVARVDTGKSVSTNTGASNSM
jgi:hypothetical protein